MANKKIEDSKKIIKEEKLKIKKEKKKLNDIKKKNSLLYKFVHKEKEYTRKELIRNSIIFLLVGIILCFIILTLLFGGKNFIKTYFETKNFLDTYNIITNKYYGEIDKDKLIESAIDGMVSSLGDDYTIYGNEEVTTEFDELVEGTYEGIGCTITKTDNGIIVYEVFDDSPAKKAGLEKDDIIIKVDDIDASTKTTSEIAEYIKGKQEKDVTIVVKRGEEEKTFKLTRSVVETPNVTSKVITTNDKKIGYIEISIFSATVKDQFKENLEKLEEENIEGLIIDVRSNNGGYLDTVVSIINQLLPKGTVIYQTEKNGKTTKYKDTTKEERTYPIAVLTDGASASASEILAGAIKESYSKGYVVGEKTFGKGTVQQVEKLKDGSMIKYTTENWLTPNGNWINEKGIEPTHVVEYTTEYMSNPTDENDTQLQKALELVSNQ